MHQEIDSFDLKTRLNVLADIVRQPDAKVGPGKKQADHVSRAVNMHIHSFFSYNCHEYSPAHIAVVCRQNNLYAAALCDFDVLDGLDEFLIAGQMLGLRAAVHLETRAYLREFSDVEINSPGETGVSYVMGAGFGCLPAPNSKPMKMLNDLRQQSNLRNRTLVERINKRLPDIALDYDVDVRPLSPGGCPTERHIVKAYRMKSEQAFPCKNKLNAFWSGLFCKPGNETAPLLNNPSALEEKMRSILVKKGGVGYVRPTGKTFPPADDFIAWVLSCNAIPMATWLDGTSPGENDIKKMLEYMKSKGAAALNIIPDRNHNIKNADERRLKIRKLSEVITAARAFSFPINIGTEMNKAGQPLFDDLDGKALNLYKSDFLRGANIMIGQTLLTRYANYSYCGSVAFSEYGNDTSRKNDFFESVGKLRPLSLHEAGRLQNMGGEKAFNCINDSSVTGRWRM